MPQNEFDVLLHRALLGACEERRLHFHEWEMYHMPDEGGQLECSFEENQVDDGEQKLRPVKPEELVTRMQQNAHQGGWNASILQREGGYHMLQLRSYGENHLCIHNILVHEPEMLLLTISLREHAREGR